MTQDGTQSLGRAMGLLDAIVADDGRTPVAILAARLGFAASSARRIVTTLRREGLIARCGHGCYGGGPRLTALAAAIDPDRRLVGAARPELRRLVRGAQWTAHLGVFDNEMVTYLVKEGREALFTREGAQLEAYCTGVGKALLAHLPSDRLARYLSGSFVRMTRTTLCDPLVLAADLADTRERGFAVDDREMSDAVACVAVPVFIDDACIAAISLSGDADHFPLFRANEIARRLRRCGEAIAIRLRGKG